MEMSKMEGRHTGTVTRQKLRVSGTFKDAETASNSRSICLYAVMAVRCDTV